jgi:hypothetical protein
LRHFLASSFPSVIYLPFQTLPPTSLPSSLTSSCYLFLSLPLNLVFPKNIYRVRHLTLPILKVG